MTYEIDMIPLDAVRINGGTQSRVALSEQTIAEYADTIRGGFDLPPVVAFFDGANFWLADGFHRYFAHKSAGAMEIAAEIHEGTNRDAVLYSVGANASHGLRRTNEDKRRAVMTMLGDAEWSAWSDREIARQCGVSHTFVAAVRSPVAAVRQQDNRESSVAQKPAHVESDSTNQVESDSTSAPRPAEEMPSPVALPPSNITPSEPEKPLAPPTATTTNSDEVLALREQLAEVSDALKSTLADNEMMGRVFDADDKLKAAMDEAKRQKAIADNAERTLAQKSGEFIERARAVTMWQNRAQKAEKKLEKYEAKK